jgi:DNA-binding HxlR family transcriptional regulator
VLPQTLKSLERDGLVSRKAIPTVPVTVEHSITPLGRTPAATVDGLRIWAEPHIDKVLKATEAIRRQCAADGRLNRHQDDPTPRGA